MKKFLFAIILLSFGEVAFAGGPTNFTFSQGQDCTAVASWEINAAAVTTANPNPIFANASVIGSIANALPVVCTAASNTVAVPLNNIVGSTRFWLVAVSNTSPVIKSNPSNAATVTLPLASPSGLGVVIP